MAIAINKEAASACQLLISDMKVLEIVFYQAIAASIFIVIRRAAV
ncbi:hypothetical protein [Comamonas testosteroni]|jgi:hypothetical protein|nr:hypothetical protein [Comamonas testosteroni]